MKTKHFILPILTIAFILASCEKNVENTVDKNQTAERDIFYSVSDIPGKPNLSGTTAHLSTEAEWDRLLDRFCEMTMDGEQVTFCNTNPSAGTKGFKDGTNTPTTIHTQNREELKAWMKAMEKAGKTINVTYDDSTGTWNGAAYTNFNPQMEQAEAISCTGTLILTGIPVIDEPIAGTVWAIQTNDDSVFILTFHGMMMMSESDEPSTLLGGYEVTINGLASTHTDINGDNFSTLEISANEGDVIIFEK